MKIQSALRCLQCRQAFQRYRQATVEIQRIVRGKISRSNLLGILEYFFSNRFVHTNVTYQILHLVAVRYNCILVTIFYGFGLFQVLRPYIQSSPMVVF